MQLTKEAFDEWQEHPVTKEVFRSLKSIKHALLEDLANGTTVGHTADVTHGLTNRMVGHVEGINQLLNMYFEEVNKE